MPVGGWLFDSGGKTWSKSFVVDLVNGTLKLSSNLTIDSGADIGIKSGEFDANDYNITAVDVNLNYTTTRTVRMGNGTWEVFSNSNNSFIIDVT